MRSGLQGKNLGRHGGRAACLCGLISAFLQEGLDVWRGEGQSGVFVRRDSVSECGEWGWEKGGVDRSGRLCICSREYWSVLRAGAQRRPLL